MTPDGVDHGVEAVTDDAVQPLDPRPHENVDELFRHVLLGHGCAPSLPPAVRASIYPRCARLRLPDSSARTVVGVPLRPELDVGEIGGQPRRASGGPAP